MDYFTSAAFWAALGNIIIVNIVLSGDNAVVIALASRSLPARQQKQAIFFGSALAILIRIVLTATALSLLSLPYLKIIGAVLLFYIGAQLLAEGSDEAHVHGHASMWHAVRTIIIADLVMSLDNVLGVAAAAKGDVVLLIVGLAISIPLIIFGSGIILKMMERFEWIVAVGAALLGYLAGEMLFSDSALQPWIQANLPHHEFLVPVIDAHLSMPGLVGAAAVLAIGFWLAKRGANDSDLSVS
jgi:YjbE family integral membrane protein